MTAAGYTGGLRGLVVAVGLGTAVLTGCGIAAADPGGRDPSPSGDSGGLASGPVRPARTAVPASRVARPPSAGPRAAASRNSNTVVPMPRRVRSPSESESVMPAAAIDPVASLDQPAATPATPATPAAHRPVISTGLRPSTARTPVFARVSPAGAIAPVSATPMPLSAFSSPAVMNPDPGTTATVMLLALTNLIHMAVVLSVAALTPAPPSPSTETPTLHLGGVDLVPSSTREITSFYGRWTYLPGAPSMFQGRQQFDVVDPTTAQTVGSFGALVSRGTGIDYTALLVTSNDGDDTSGRVPPVGSMIANFQLGRIGLAYSDIAASSGDVVSFTITTPSRDFALSMPLDAAKGIADRTVDNRPIDLGNGFSIAPADPAGETLTAISGVIPLCIAVQGQQVFNVRDSAGNPVGSFEGVFTTTADVVGTYTQAVMVTGNDGNNVGTAPGQVPPVGSVYNVIYPRSDARFFLYASLPSHSGTEVSVIAVDHGQVSNSAATFIDASKPPATESLSAAGGYRFVPVSALVPSGVNGLPPRDVQVQGYQRYDVYDADGTRLGSVDADVSTQWDLFGIRSEALLITGRTEDGAGKVPPVGSVFNFLHSGDSGFGSSHSVVPLDSGDLTSFTLTTPWGDIPMPSTLRPAIGRTPVSYYSPF